MNVRFCMKHFPRFCENHPYSAFRIVCPDIFIWAAQYIRIIERLRWLQMVQSCPVDRRPFSVIYLQGSSQRCIKVRWFSDIMDVCPKGFLIKLSVASLCFSFLWKCPGCQSRTRAVVRTLGGRVVSVCKCRHAACAWVCLTAHTSESEYFCIYLCHSQGRDWRNQENAREKS